MFFMTVPRRSVRCNGNTMRLQTTQIPTPNAYAERSYRSKNVKYRRSNLPVEGATKRRSRPKQNRVTGLVNRLSSSRQRS